MPSGLLYCTQEQFVPIGFIWMECSHGARSKNLGSSWSPSAVSPSCRSFFIRVIIRPPVWRQAWEWGYRNGNVDFIGRYLATVGKTSTQPHAEEMYCTFQSNLTRSKLPAWLSEQQVKGWNCCLSWTAMFLRPQHPLLETQETQRFLFRKLDAALPEPMLPERVSWCSGFKVAHLWKRVSGSTWPQVTKLTPLSTLSEPNPLWTVTL